MPSWRDFLKKPARRPAAAGTQPRTDWTNPRPGDRSASPRATPSAQQPAAESEPEPAEAEMPGPEQPAASAAPPADRPAEEAQTPAEKPREEPAEKPAEKPAERPAKKEAPVAKTTQEKQEKEPGKGRETGKKVMAGANALRARIASIVWLVAVVCAATLAIGALMFALKMNQQNDIVKFILDLADKLSFGTFKDFTGKSAATKEHLTDYGISAVIYLVIGKVLDRIIRP